MDSASAFERELNDLTKEGFQIVNCVVKAFPGPQATFIAVLNKSADAGLGIPAASSYQQ